METNIKYLSRNIGIQYEIKNIKKKGKINQTTTIFLANPTLLNVSLIKCFMIEAKITIIAITVTTGLLVNCLYMLYISSNPFGDLTQVPLEEESKNLAINTLIFGK